MNHYFNEDDCVTLTQAPLDVVCKDDDYFKTLRVEENDDDEFIQWLKDRLPSTYSIVRYPGTDSVIRIWI
ncbi:unnamed protein product [Adineta steineri]|uniref:Uncharacterized protein n=1 Tax=Adineta steineri TaxID=433720 RepID=A0A819VT65_9BILA|nr:unnamed protein product [Adineta steineri]CAF4113917.1 unnamed protein product [Adineta steineri]